MRGAATVVGGSNPNFESSSSRGNDRGRDQVVGGTNCNYCPAPSRGYGWSSSSGRDQVVGGSNYNYSSAPSRGYGSPSGQDQVVGGSNYNYSSANSRGYSTRRRDTSPSWRGFSWYPENGNNFHWNPVYWFPRDDRNLGNNRPIRGCCSGLCTGLAVSIVGVLARSVQLVALGVILGAVLSLAGGCGPRRDVE